MRCFKDFERDFFKCSIDNCCRGNVRLTEQGPLCDHHYLTSSVCKKRGCNEIGPFDGYCRDHYMQQLCTDYDPEPMSIEERVSHRHTSGIALFREI